MALNMTESQLSGRRVVSQDGHVLGEVTGLIVDTGTWRVIQLAVHLRRQSLEPLRLKKPVLGSQTIRLATDDISGVGDAVVLKQRRDELSFAGGEELREEPAPPPPGQ